MARIFGKKKELVEEKQDEEVVVLPPRLPKEVVEEPVVVEEPGKIDESKVKEVIVEREITLTLINEKLNIILNTLQEFKEE